MKKALRIFLITLSILALLCIGFIIWAVVTDSEDDPTPTPIPITDPIKNELTVIDEIKQNEQGNVIINIDNLIIQISQSSEDEKQKTMDDPSNGDIVSGQTKDGSKFEGRGDTIYVEKDKTVIQGKITSNDGKKDAGKAAGVISAVTNKAGYSQNKDDWNHGYSIRYIESANCLLYYPAQLVFQSEDQNGELVFSDPRSQATMRVSLSKNEYTCMDEVEKEIQISSVQALASGTDWYSAESYSAVDKQKYTLFSLYGFGNKYQVNVHFNYEDKYSFVFSELRSLIRCRFIEDGVWVSNAKVETTGKVVKAVQADPAVYDPAIQKTSFYLDRFDCVVHYPDIFTKAYCADDGSEAFTDPKTGAYITVLRQDSNLTQEKLQSMLMNQFGMTESDLVGEFGCRGKALGTSEGKIIYAAVRDGKLYFAMMVYPSEYNYVYGRAYKMLELALPGEATSTIEMQDIYYPSFSANLTLPLEFKETGVDGDVHILKDSFRGLEMRVTFTKITDPADWQNLYNVFHVVAKDSDIIYGEYYIKWHNKDGAFIGAVSSEYACLIELSYPNAYDVYGTAWDRFAINFSDEKEYTTSGDLARKKVAEKLAEEFVNDKPTPTPDTENVNDKPTPTPDTENVNDKPTPTPDTENVNDKPTPTPKPENVNDKPTPTPTPKPAEETFDSSYDMLVNSKDSVFSELPFSPLAGLKKDEVYYGEYTNLRYDLSADDYQDLLDYIDQMYDMGFEELSSESYYDGEDYRCDTYYFRSSSEETGLPDLLLCIDAYLSEETGFARISYINMGNTYEYIPGVLNIDYETCYEYQLFSWEYEQNTIDRMTSIMTTCADYESYFGSLYGKICRLSCVSILIEEFHGDYEDAEIADYVSLEIGHIEYGVFVADEIYVDNAVHGIARLYSDGSYELITSY